MRVALVSPESPFDGRMYGAERLLAGLSESLSELCDLDWRKVSVDESTWSGVVQSYLESYWLDVTAYDLVISTKNPTFMVQHPNHICWLLHQIRVFYDRFDDEYGGYDAATVDYLRGQRQLIHQADTFAFSRIRKTFAIGHEVARRLKAYNGFDAQVLCPPLANQEYLCGGQEYLLLPGRLHRWKRVELALQALQLIPDQIELLIPGTGEDEAHLRQVAAGDNRVRFLGYVSDAELIRLYADALAVLFVPKEEDFGYVAVEAMMSHKPIITCTDSGEPSRLIEDGWNGFVVNPSREELGAVITLLIRDRTLARELGERGFRTVIKHSWTEVARCLLAAGDSAFAQVAVQQDSAKL